MESAKATPLCFTASVDGIIIEGFLDDRKAMFMKLKNMGFSRNAVNDRARRLGLSDQFIKRCAIGDPDVGLRICLRCGERFLSVGFQNRLCARCKNRRY